MATITTRVQGDDAKGSPLTNVEVDDNFINLNTAKYESGDSASFSGLTLSSTGGTKLLVENTDTNWAGLELKGGGNQASYIFFKDDTAERARISVLDSENLVISNGSTPIERLKIASDGSFVYNEGSYDVDFRVESDSNNNMLFVDSTNSRVGILNGSPDFALDVGPTNVAGGDGIQINATRNATLRFLGNDTSIQADEVTGRIEWYTSDTNNPGIHAQILTRATNTAGSGELQIWSGTAGSINKNAHFRGDQTVFNEDSNDMDFRVKSDTNANAFFVEGETSSVGIGTNDPAARVHILNGSDAVSILFINGADTTTEYMALGVEAGKSTLTAGGSGGTSNSLVFRTADAGVEAEVMSLAPNGTISNTNNQPTIRPSLLLDFANSKTLDPRIDFTRSSTATYYDGKTHAKAEENLLKSSQAIGDSNWTVKTGITIHLDNAAAPDGTTTATKLTPTTASANHYLGQLVKTTNGNSYSVSFYAKANGYDNVGSTDHYYGEYQIIFSLTGSGVLDKTANVSNASVTSVGNSWYRCQFTYSTTKSDVTFTIYPTAASAISGTSHYNYTGDGTSGCYVWGAQFEHRDSVTAYTPTTSKPITNYIPVLQTAASGTARFDHDPVTGESLGLLIEEQRTNFFPYSDLNAGWGSSSSAWIQPNATIAPDGTHTAAKIGRGSTAAYQTVYDSISGLPTNTDLRFSFYCKTAEDDTAFLQYNDGTWWNGSFDFTLQDMSSSKFSNVTFEDVGNGWLRVSFTAQSAVSTIQFTIHPRTGSSLETGNGYDGMYFWGFQVEQGSFPTSYIPTSGSQVTRSADAASMTGTNFSSWFNNQEGTFFADIDVEHSGGNSKGILSVNGSISGSGGRLVNVYLSSTLIAYLDTFSFGANPISTAGGSNPTKLSASYSMTSYAFAADGSSISSNTGQSYYLDQAVYLQIGDTYNVGSYKLNGYFKKLSYYPQAFTSATVVALTED